MPLHCNCDVRAVAALRRRDCGPGASGGASCQIEEEENKGMSDAVAVNSDFTAEAFLKTFTNLAALGCQPQVHYPGVHVRAGEAEAWGTSGFAVNGCGPAKPIHKEETVNGIQHVPYFLSINRFVRSKKIDLAVRAFAILKRKLGQALPTNEANGGAEERGIPVQGRNGRVPGDVQLIVAGGYDSRLTKHVEYRQELHALVASEGVADAVVFLPSFTDEQKRILLPACLAVLYTPENEHFGIVPIEAQAASRPVIACDSGGPLETVQHNVTGFLCEPTPMIFAAAMEVFACEPGKSDTMGKAARKHVEAKFSRHTFGAKLCEMVLKLIPELKPAHDWGNVSAVKDEGGQCGGDKWHGQRRMSVEMGSGIQVAKAA
eukprot:TRINITY_DN2994_c0_g1_i3.p1 TRINITY_DN2994_c0_g1~~TRINITY_DN2994_c0_g1_i3.p1  ORF type:complete len:375 (-),score=76.17 TRINITY_DN2994_c0_g1_i3:640-1764(-)